MQAWGAIQIQVGGQRKRIVGNDISCTAPLGWDYLLSAVVETVDNEVIDNRLTGKTRRAYIVIDSGWGQHADPAHKVNEYAGPVDGSWSIVASTGNRVQGNHITATSAVPAIYLGQIQDAWGTQALLGTDVIGNTIVSDKQVKQLHLVESTPSSLNGGQLLGNVWDDDATAADFTFPGGAASAHFSPAQSTP